MTASVLVPTAITDSILLSSTVLEDDYPPYDPGATYAIGVRCISTATHRIYESAQAGNINHDPTNQINRTTPSIWWNDLGPTNKWAMFDGEISTPTVATGSLTIVIKPGFFNSIGGAAIEADHMEITVVDAPAGNQIYHYSEFLEVDPPPDYYEYWFQISKIRTDFLAMNIDQYNEAVLTLTLTRTLGTTVKCGMWAVGDMRPLGLTQRGVKVTPKSYSYISIDAFGNNKIIRRKKAKDMTFSCYVDLSEADAVLETITSLMDVPCFWIGSELPEHVGQRCFGLGSGELSYDKTNQCFLTQTVKGLI